MPDSQQLLEMYRTLWEEKRGSGVVHTPQEWDKRAPGWAAEMAKSRLTQRRIEESVQLLERRGILGRDRDVIDIGCGPGLFVAEFAARCHRAVGTDFSPVMLQYAEEYCTERGILNTSFAPCDFKTVSAEEMGWEKQFDLVFTSMTPAISETGCIEKMIAMSRGWCCNTTCIFASGNLQKALAGLLGADVVRPAWDGNWFHFLNSIVYLMGYFPETSYYDVEYTEERKITRLMVEEELRRLCRERMPEADRVEEAYEMLMAQTAEGIYVDKCHNWYGFILWDTRKRTERW